MKDVPDDPHLGCGNDINFEYWSKIATVEIWEAAAMIWGADPRAFQAGEVADQLGNYPDLSSEERQVTSGVRSGDLMVCNEADRASPNRNTHVLTSSLIEWFRENGHRSIAHSFDSADVSEIAQPEADAKRRLRRLRTLGGDCTQDKLDSSWNVTRLKELRELEVAEGRERTSQKTLRKDLIAAAEAEREEQRAGLPHAAFPGTR